MALLGPVVLSAAPTAPAAKVRAWVEEDRIVVSRRVMFRPGESQTTADSRPVLDAMAAALKAQGPDVVFAIEGHSDKGGDEDENFRLSKARAEFVLTALAERGVAASRMSAYGFGSSRPLVGDDSREQYRNRRIEIYIRPAPPTTTPPPLISLLEDEGAVPRFLVPLLDDEGPTAIAIPLLEDEAPVVLASAAPRVPLLDDEDDLMMPRFTGGTGSAPRIPLLDATDAPRGIGLVD